VCMEELVFFYTTLASVCGVPGGNVPALTAVSRIRFPSSPLPCLPDNVFARSQDNDDDEQQLPSRRQ
jgi:hypothetical protein